MEIRSMSGLEIDALPECARCGITEENPENMDECPIKNFDNDGEICVPELCEVYEEA